MRVRHVISRIGWLVAAVSALLFAFAGSSVAQVEITPETSITPSSHVTSWIYQMAIASAVMGVLILVGIALGYLRFAPKFFGREERRAAAPPGSRPEILARQAAAVRWTAPATSGGHAVASALAPAPAARATATAVAERAAPAPPPATAGPEGEPAVQEDAVGAAEEAAPEPRPSAKTPEEVGTAAQQAPAQPPAATAAPAPAAAAPQPAAAAASHSSSALDQETFDRVLEEQLGKGVDRRVAEGRARAAAVVAARKKAQG